MLPDLDGFEVCRRLRNDGMRTPVLFLTARDATDDKVRGLTLGGDDYLVKPFSLEELVARISAVLRRSGLIARGRGPACADLEMDDDAHVVRRAGVEVPLSPTEYNLLRFLLANQGRVLSKPQILDHVWQYDFGGDGGVVETYIGYLRKKVDTRRPPAHPHRPRVSGTRCAEKLRCRCAPACSRAWRWCRSCSSRSAFIIARTTEANLVDRVDAAAGVGPAGAIALATGAGPARTAARRSGRRRATCAGPARASSSVVVRRTSTGERRGPSPLAEAGVGVRTGDAVHRRQHVGGPAGTACSRRGCRRRCIVVALSLQDVDATMSRLRLVLVVAAIAIVIGILGARRVLGAAPRRAADQAHDRDRGRDRGGRPLATRAGGGRRHRGRASSATRSTPCSATIEDAFAERSASEARLRRFVADASHELRTPVTTIRGYAELYRHGGLADAADLDQAMRRTEQESVRMASLVDDLLLLARLDEGRPLARAPVDLGVLGVDAAADARAVAPDRVDHRRGRPRASPSTATRTACARCVGNLVGNALVHTPAGTPVSVRVHNGGGARRRRGARRRPGHDPGAGRARVRALLARRRVTFAPPRRCRPRPRHRAGHRRRARRRRSVLSSSAGAGTTVRVELPRAAASN